MLQQIDPFEAYGRKTARLFDAWLATGWRERKPRKAHACVIPEDKITPDTPLRLEDAMRVAFPAGGMTVSGLRREAARGRLLIEIIAGKHFTTLRAIEEMRNQCRDQQRALDYGSNLKNATRAGSSFVAQRGSSVTERVRSARAALEKTAQGLNGPLPTTSPTNTERPASGIVIPLKSSSSTS